MERVALVFTCWLVVWIGVAASAGALSGYLTGGPGGAHGGVGTVASFWGMWGAFFAVVTCLAWEWILPRRVNEWMEDNGPPSRSSG